MNNYANLLNFMHKVSVKKWQIDFNFFVLLLKQHKIQGGNYGTENY